MKEPSSVNKHNAKSKDRNFRIMKKTIMDRRAEIEQLGVGVGFGPMVITGLNNHQPQLSHIQQPTNTYHPVIPKPPSQNMSRNRTVPRHY